MIIYKQLLKQLKACHIMVLVIKIMTKQYTTPCPDIVS